MVVCLRQKTCFTDANLNMQVRGFKVKSHLGKLMLFFGLFNLHLWRNVGLSVRFAIKLPFNRTCELQALYDDYTNPKFQGRL